MPKSARQVLGDAIKKYRTDRGYDRHRVADLASARVSDVENWENGRAIPTHASWMLLVNKLQRRLSEFTSTYEAACNEEAAARTKPAAAPLTTKPFEVLAPKPVPAPAPAPTPRPPAPTAAPAPAPAPARPVTPPVTNKRPPDALTRAGTLERTEVAVRIMRDNPDLTVAQINDAVRAECRGVGLNTSTIAAIRVARKQQAQRNAAAVKRAEAAVQHVDSTTTTSHDALVEWTRNMLRKSPSIHDVGEGGIVTLSMQKMGSALSSAEINAMRAELRAEALTPRAASAPAPAVPVMATPAPATPGDIEAAVQLVLDAIPDLATFNIQVIDGEVDVTYTTEKKVVERANKTLTMKRA